MSTQNLIIKDVYYRLTVT